MFTLLNKVNSSLKVLSDLTFGLKVFGFVVLPCVVVLVVSVHLVTNDKSYWKSRDSHIFCLTISNQV